MARLEADFFPGNPATIKTLLNRLKTKEFIAMEARVSFMILQILEADHLEDTWQAL